jgi:uncharacterized protein (TIGR00369 family)
MSSNQVPVADAAVAVPVLEPHTEHARQTNARSTFRRRIGIQVVSAEAGVAELTLVVDPYHMQSLGSVHGGVLATLIDSAIANAVYSARSDGRRGVTVDLNVNFLKAVSQGSLRAIARVELNGNSIMLGTCEVLNDAGERVALGKATFFFKDPSGSTEGNK